MTLNESMRLKFLKILNFSQLATFKCVYYIENNCPFLLIIEIYFTELTEKATFSQVTKSWVKIYTFGVHEVN